MRTRSRTLFQPVPAPFDEICPTCRVSVPVLSTCGAAALLSVSEAVIWEDLGSGLLHPVRPGTICGLSAAARFSKHSSPMPVKHRSTETKDTEQDKPFTGEAE